MACCEDVILVDGETRTWELMSRSGPRGADAAQSASVAMLQDSRETYVREQTMELESIAQEIYVTS